MKESTITAKIQLILTETDKLLLDKTMSAYTSACNFVSRYIYSSHNLSQHSLNGVLYTRLRSEFGLRSQMAQSVLKTVIASYKTIKQNQNEWIQPKYNKSQYDLVWNRDYSLNKDKFSVNTLEGRIKVEYFSKGKEKYFTDKYKFGTAKLVCKNKKYYLHIPVTEQIEECQIEDICHIEGIDRGINFTAVTYNSHGKTHFINGRYLKEKRAKYKLLRKSLQKRQTPSSRRRLKAIGQRENRWMNDVNHCISKALVEQNPKHTLFILEDLSGVRQATEKVRKKNRYVSVSWSFYDLEQKIRYKAERNQSLVINVDPRYTSQTCPKCGHIHKTNRNKKTHVFCCKNCGYTSNDDRIAAMNLYNKGLAYIADNLKNTDTDEYILFVEGAVNHPAM